MKQALILIIILSVGFAAVFGLSKKLENLKPKSDPARADEDLYFSPSLLAAAGRDFRGLIADWYWINSLQYVGGKLVENKGKVNINDLKPLNPRLLYPMLDTASTLDPKFTTVYTYGASVLPAIDTQLAIKLAQKGITENPDNWHLYHNLGYIYWQMKDYPRAADAYLQGSGKPDAPAWMKQMSANMTAKGGSREFALDVYKQMFESAEDDQTKKFAELRYMEMQSLNELDNLNSAMKIFIEKFSRCPRNFNETLPYLDKRFLHINQSSEITDPTGIPYVLAVENGQCEARLSGESKIPRSE